MSTPDDDDLALRAGDSVMLKGSGTAGRRRFARYGLPAGSCPEMAPGPPTPKTTSWISTRSSGSAAPGYMTYRSGYRI
jgi:hypothetical protein